MNKEAERQEKEDEARGPSGTSVQKGEGKEERQF